MSLESTLVKETVSPDRKAPSDVVLGKTAARMDEVICLPRDMGGVSAYGTFAEEHQARAEEFARFAEQRRQEQMLRYAHEKLEKASDMSFNRSGIGTVPV